MPNKVLPIQGILSDARYLQLGGEVRGSVGNCSGDAGGRSFCGARGVQARSDANQVFQWRPLYRDGKLGAPLNAPQLPVVSVVENSEPPQAEPEQVAREQSGAIRIEVHGKARISLEGSIGPAIIRAVLKSLRS